MRPAEMIEGVGSYRVTYAWLCDCGTGVAVPSRVCPFCGLVGDLDDDVQRSGDDVTLPEPGTLHICFRCLCLSVCGDTLQLRPLTQAETEALTPTERENMRAVQRAIRERKQRAREN